MPRAHGAQDAYALSCPALTLHVELHNESFNVWSHLLGCGIFVAILIHVSSCDAAAGLPPAAAALERWPLYVFVLSAIGCLFASAIYHLCGMANERWHAHLASLDYVGIISLRRASRVCAHLRSAVRWSSCSYR